ncbi:MAG: M14 family metallopeptidase [Candidatus Paceibacterota bacterium]
MKQFIVILVIVLIALGVFGWTQGWFNSDLTTEPDTEQDGENDENSTGTTTDKEDGVGLDEDGGVIGSSAGDRDIMAYQYGDGSTELLFVGGVHGGYSANTALVAFEVMDWLEENPNVIPENVKVTVIPVLNPDGLNEVVGTTGRFSVSDIPSGDRSAGRFNANNVDLNRNFDCNWQSTGTWQSQEVDAGDSVFSEPESQALRDYIRSNEPDAAVVFFSAAGEVVASSCNNDSLPETQQMVSTYANASGYTAQETFGYYDITGDAVDWMAKQGIPAISVVLGSHNSAEWSKNRAGIEALFERYEN